MASRGRIVIDMGDLSITALRATFKLDGEDVVRLSSGKTVRPPTRVPALVFTHWLGQGRQNVMLYHRIKFGLHHGYLPRIVDHEDLDKANHKLGNLRAATASQNTSNKRPRKNTTGLPRCVRLNRGSLRFYVMIREDGKQVYHGTYDTAEEASRVAESRLRAVQGEFYHAPTD